MSLPKRRGFRRILVDRLDYDWRYSNPVDEPILKVFVRPSVTRSKLIITIDCQDPWLQKRENIIHHGLQPCSSPVTPKFVAMAIEAGIDLGWQPKLDYSQFEIKYRTGKFLIEKYSKK